MPTPLNGAPSSLVGGVQCYDSKDSAGSGEALKTNHQNWPAIYRSPPPCAAASSSKERESQRGGTGNPTPIEADGVAHSMQQQQHSAPAPAATAPVISRQTSQAGPNNSTNKSSQLATSRTEASESTSLPLVATEMSVKSDDSDHNYESTSNIKPVPLPVVKGKVPLADAFNKSHDQDEQELANGHSLRDHAFDSNELFASPKTCPISWWTRRANDSVNVGPSFKDQVRSVEDPRSRQAVVAAARSDRAHAPPAATGANEKAHGLGLPSFKDQISDRPRCPSYEEQIGDCVAAETTSPSIEAWEGPAFKDQVREFVFPSERPPLPVNLDPSIVFADAYLLDPSVLPTPVLPAHVLEQNAETSFEVRTKREIAEKDAEIERLKEQIEALAQTANQSKTVDHINESTAP